jgi:hypothetical protein
MSYLTITLANETSDRWLTLNAASHSAKNPFLCDTSLSIAPQTSAEIVHFGVGEGSATYNISESVTLALQWTAYGYYYTIVPLLAGSSAYTVSGFDQPTLTSDAAGGQWYVAYALTFGEVASTEERA